MRAAPIRFGSNQQVSFRYDHRRPTQVLNALNLMIRARQNTAIVGPSAARKTTIADLVMGLIEPDQGVVLVDEVPLTPERMRAGRD
jgi:ATP-binding cassette subfamily C protein